MIADNEITKVTGLDAQKLCRLHTLELRGNKLTSTDGIALPLLKNLFLVCLLLSCLSVLKCIHFAEQTGLCSFFTYYVRTLVTPVILHFPKKKCIYEDNII